MASVFSIFYKMQLVKVGLKFWLFSFHLCHSNSWVLDNLAHTKDKTFQTDIVQNICKAHAPNRWFTKQKYNLSLINILPWHSFG